LMFKTKLKLVYARWAAKTKFPPWLILTMVTGGAITVFAKSLPPVHIVVTLIDPTGKPSLANNFPVPNPLQSPLDQVGFLILFFPLFGWLIVTAAKARFGYDDED